VRHFRIALRGANHGSGPDGGILGPQTRPVERVGGSAGRPGLQLRTAIERDVPEPHVMTLSTVDSEGRPTFRALILKNVDESGW
jgi:hypothetical protein